MIDYSKVKMVIWDLDDTFWEGTLSEGTVISKEENMTLVKEMTDRGIINSLCSKNDFEKAKSKLVELGIWEYFVFPQISWQSKGEVIKETIKEMGLRACNVLFVDDNASNRNEAVFYSDGLMTMPPEELEGLLSFVVQLPISDRNHMRLQRYKLLEKKQAEKRICASNEEFLKSSNIVVSISKDCEQQIQRIHELIQRTNQLNYTKRRLTIDELMDVITDASIECGYVEVTDRFGEYGICGFYAKKDDNLLDFLFSCRTMGMGIEQYVYAKLGFPKLEIHGEVAYAVKEGEYPEWISGEKYNVSAPTEREVITGFHALIKGPCDMEQIMGYIQNEGLFDKEFTYINEKTGVSIESYNHTWQMVEAKTLSHRQKKMIIDELPFSSSEFFSEKIYSEKYDAVFFSLFTDPNLGLYRRKKTGEIIAFGEYCNDLTNTNNWEGIISGRLFNANCKFTESSLKRFSEAYEYIGRITPEQIVENLEFIRNNMPSKTLLVLFLGVEFPYPNNNRLSCEDRHIFHKELNALVRQWAARFPNVRILEFGAYVKSPKEMLNNINHFIKPVYYEMTKEVINIIQNATNRTDIRRRSWLFMQKTYFIQANPIFAGYLKVRSILAKFLKRR